MSNTGNGTSLAFSGGITYAARVKSIGGWARSVADLDDSALDSVGYAERVPGDLIQHAPFSVEVYDNLDDQFTAPVGDVGTITITFDSGAVLAGTGFIIEDEGTPLNTTDRAIKTLSVAFDGKTGPTLTPA